MFVCYLVCDSPSHKWGRNFLREKMDVDSLTDKHCSSQLREFLALVTTVIPCTSTNNDWKWPEICMCRFARTAGTCQEPESGALTDMLTDCHTPRVKLGLGMHLQIAAEALCGLLHHDLIHTIEPKAH